MPPVETVEKKENPMNPELPKLEDPEMYETWKLMFEIFIDDCGITEEKVKATKLLRCLPMSILSDLNAQFPDGSLRTKDITTLFSNLDRMFKKAKLEMARKAHVFELRQKGRTLEDFMNECKREANQ